MMNREQFAILGRLDNVAARHRRQAQIAAHQMQVVARQQNNLAGPNDEVIAVLTLDPDSKLTLDNVMIKNQVGHGAESRRAMFGRHARRHAPRREKIGVKEHAAGQMRYPQDVG